MWLFWAIVWWVIWWAVDWLIWDDPIWEWLVWWAIVWSLVDTGSEQKSYSKLEALDIIQEAYLNWDIWTKEYYRDKRLILESPPWKRFNLTR